MFAADPQGMVRKPSAMNVLGSPANGRFAPRAAVHPHAIEPPQACHSGRPTPGWPTAPASVGEALALGQRQAYPSSAGAKAGAEPGASPRTTLRRRACQRCSPAPATIAGTNHNASALASPNDAMAGPGQ
jgi:hypothetical protein